MRLVPLAALLLAACPAAGPKTTTASAGSGPPATPCARAFPEEIEAETLAGLTAAACPEGAGMLVRAGVKRELDVDAATALKERLAPDLLAVPGVAGVAVTATCDDDSPTTAIAVFVDFCLLPLPELAALLAAKLAADPLAGTTVPFVLLPGE